ncbi:diguanylate cyclase [Wenzhouxiangella marina]|uniref:diguanylate cyclase n=1 Tax=Wenzhouxiangella marina TaxID=1579979 RepID=A0A0K0XZS6_9GAMM|nr:GGDEF domain-containing protein [Wenzhouxiangella marina]AKS43184.1 hypothetical protein WM2015_2827 [Wenzhouxiangella marina]MBB6087131.1 diguanylate cyclase (GGDEF)-like protein [Wenzhouxiangella marina]
MAQGSRSDEQTDPCTLLIVNDQGDAVEPRSACLVVIRGERLGERIEPDALPAVIGRGSDADFRIPSPSVSRRHCRVLQDRGTWWVEDLRSTNLTLVNEHPIDRRPLNDGDRIRVGDSELKFLAAGSTEAIYLAKLHEHVIRDELTGLHNRRHLMAGLDDELARRRQRMDSPLSLAILDVDHFKAINDRAGHLVGDEVLRQLARLLEGAVRETDLLARIGGEEFAVLMPDSGLAPARSICERLRSAVERAEFAVAAGSGIGTVTVSIGLAEWGAGMNEASDLLRAADAELYRAKREGRNRVYG